MLSSIWKDIQSSAGSVFILLGIALVLLSTGTLDVLEIRSALETVHIGTPLWVTAGALFVIGFGVKIALVPLHTWLPDALLSSSTPLITQPPFVAPHHTSSVADGFDSRYAELSTVLSDLIEEIEGGTEVDFAELAFNWTANNDA